MTHREHISDQPPVKIETLRQRIQMLYQQGAVRAQSDRLLSQAFEELAHAVDELQSANHMLHQQHEQWLNQQTAQELECQRYKDLFEHAPAGYLVTSIDGAIRQANAAALALLETSAQTMVGRSFAIFVPEGQRRAFREQIAQVLQEAAPQELVIRMCSWAGTPFTAKLMASVLRGANGRPQALYWLLRVLDEPQSTAYGGSRDMLASNAANA